MFPAGELPSRQETRTAKRFLKCSGKENKRYALPAWPDGTQLKDLAELEKGCQDM